MRLSAAFVLLLPLAMALGCSKSTTDRLPGKPAGEKKKLTIGFSMDTLKEERWQRDRDLFKAKAEELGGRSSCRPPTATTRSRTRRRRTSSPRASTSSSWCRTTRKTAATIVESAHKLGVPVIAYDRLILDSDLDLYVSFDNVSVGELQAEYAREAQAQGQLRPHRRRAHRQQRACSSARGR